MPRYKITAKCRVNGPCPYCDGTGRESRSAEFREVEVVLAEDAPKPDTVLMAAIEQEMGADYELDDFAHHEKPRIEEVPDLPPSPRSVMQAAGVPMLFDEAALV